MRQSSGLPSKNNAGVSVKQRAGCRAGYPSAKKLLTKAYWRKNKVNNLILLCMVSVVVFISFSIFSLIPEKINADTANYIYTSGMTADAYIENGTEELEARIETVSFVSETGHEKYAGEFMKGGAALGECIVYDEQTFQTMISPALIHLAGNYPKSEEEIMLSAETLEQLGIDSPRIGMIVSLNVAGDAAEQEFVLSGYYEQAVKGVSKAFLSEAFLSKAGIGMFPCRILMQTDGSFLAGEQIESLLSNELWMWMDEEQYIVANDSPAYQAIRSTVGSYRMGVFWCLCLFLFLFFILYNLKAISLESDIRSFALFQTIGVSDKEIRQIFWNLTWILWVVGAAAGSAFGVLAVICLFPDMIGRLYPDTNQAVSMFEPGATSAGLCVIWLVSGLMTAAVSGMSMRKMKKLSLREAEDYAEYKPPKRANLHDYAEKRNRRNVLGGLAWAGAFRSKKKCIGVICFLFLGWEMVLCACVLSKGLDRMNELEQNPDFSVMITKNARQVLSEEETADWTDKAQKYWTTAGQRVSAQDFQIYFDVEEEEEPYVKEELKNWVRQANAAFHSEGYAFELPLYEITCNSDAVAENEESMRGNRTMLFTVCAFLLLAGIVSEIGMTITSLMSRKREFMLLGQIGMTKKQIRKMLVLENLIYFGISAALVLTVGNLLLFLLQSYMKTQIDYFTFAYPAKEWAVMFLLLGALSVLTTQILCRAAEGNRQH